MKKHVILESVLRNVAPKFHKAIWRSYQVNNCYDSVSQMGKSYNVRNCNYRIEDNENNIIRIVENGKLDSYGTRYN